MLYDAAYTDIVTNCFWPYNGHIKLMVNVCFTFLAKSEYNYTSKNDCITKQKVCAVQK